MVEGLKKSKILMVDDTPENIQVHLGTVSTIMINSVRKRSLPMTHVVKLEEKWITNFLI